jgi:hypothetical protein
MSGVPTVPLASISSALITWLSGYTGITSTDRVDTDQVSDEAVSLGMFKAPGRNETIFTDGSRDVTAYYIFRARRDSSQDDMRVDNQEWLEALETWVREQNIARSFPSLTGGRTCYAVRVSESGYLLEATEAEIVYQVGLEITYFEPKTLTQPVEETEEEPVVE